MNWVNLLTISIFTLAFALETLYSIKKKKNLFDHRDSLANILLGLLYTLFAVFFTIFIYYIYEFLYQYRIFNLELSVWSILALVILDDLIDYVAHRLQHENRFFWASHETHHSSEYYNFTTGIRLSIASPLVIWPFWTILPLLGFKTSWIMLVGALGYIYGILVHTQTIKTLGFLEKILVTPSHHRVHHGKNDEYVNRNYGVVFIFWDRFFKTFTPENAPVEYGTLHIEKSKSPLKLTINPWINYFRRKDHDDNATN